MSAQTESAPAPETNVGSVSDAAEVPASTTAPTKPIGEQLKLEESLSKTVPACDVNSGDGAQIDSAQQLDAQSAPLDGQSAPLDGQSAPEPSEVRSHSSDSGDSDDVADCMPKPQPNLNKAGLKMPDFFDQLEAKWVGDFNERMAVPYKDYDSSSALGKISWSDFALAEDDNSIRKGHHAICPLVRCRKSGAMYRCKIVSCSRIHFNLTTLGFKEAEYAEEIRSYLLERQYLFAFEHPFVRAGLGFFTDSNFNFGVFMADCPHGTLLDYYEKQEDGKIVSQFKEEEVRMLAAQLVLALEYLHCVGCVHRDVQASNVLVDARGYAKLTDFAITAGPLKPAERLFSVTCFRYYAAPEYFNDRGYGFPVDFYALGLMLYELLTQECFSDQDDIFDCDGSVDWGILPDELAALLRERRLADLQNSGADEATIAAEAAASSAQLLPQDHSVPSEAARGFVDDCLIYEPEFRPDRNSARFYDWFDGVDFERLYRQDLEMPWRPTKVVSYAAGPDEEYPLELILDQKPVPASLQEFTHLL